MQKSTKTLKNQKLILIQYEKSSLAKDEEEARLERLKMKEVQTTNRELAVRLKEKESQLAKVRELNRELRRANKLSGLGSKDRMEEVKSQLEEKDRKLQVQETLGNTILVKIDSEVSYYSNSL